MLPAALFSPLDLDDAIEDTDAAYGARGVVDLLVAALTDPRIRRDTEIDPYLERLKSACRQTRRYHEAVAVFERIGALNPARRHEMVAEIALVHAHRREPALGLTVLRAACAEQRRLSARRRSAAFCLIAELAATVLRDLALARELAAMSQTAAQVRARPRKAALYPGLDAVELLAAERRPPRLALVRGPAAA